MIIIFSEEDPIQIEKEIQFQVLATAIPEPNETITNRSVIVNRDNSGVNAEPDNINGEYLELYPNITNGITYLKNTDVGKPLEYDNATEWSELGSDVNTVVDWKPNIDFYEEFSYKFIVDYLIDTGSGSVPATYERTMDVTCLNTWIDSKDQLKDFFDLNP